mmetsp:Transcript_24870/g.44075  ORF Transcript_24870/g.44075 Transcript_24870/m.44075 type:complete len:99 (+) Transcript_24870:114-410(+)
MILCYIYTKAEGKGGPSPCLNYLFQCYDPVLGGRKHQIKRKPGTDNLDDGMKTKSNSTDVVVLAQLFQKTDRGRDGSQNKTGLDNLDHWLASRKLGKG